MNCKQKLLPEDFPAAAFSLTKSDRVRLKRFFDCQIGILQHEDIALVAADISFI